MKNKRFLIILCIIMVALLVGGIFSFSLMYKTVPEITKTKLQAFAFEKIDGKTIYCQNDKTIIVPQQAANNFDYEKFSQEVKTGDKLLVRLLSNEIAEMNDTYTAYAIITTKGEYLSFENTALALTAQNNTAYIVLIGSLITSLSGIIFSVLSIFKN